MCHTIICDVSGWFFDDRIFVRQYIKNRLLRSPPLKRGGSLSRRLEKNILLLFIFFVNRENQHGLGVSMRLRIYDMGQSA